MARLDNCRRIQFWQPDTSSVSGMLLVEREDRLKTTYSENFAIAVVYEGAFDDCCPWSSARRARSFLHEAHTMSWPNMRGSISSAWCAPFAPRSGFHPTSISHSFESRA